MKHLAAALAFCVSLTASGYSLAQTWPSKPVTLIVPVAAGGGSDLLARGVAERLAPLLGQPVIVDNRPGAGGIVSTSAALKAVPDGYTLAHVGSAMAMGAAFTRDLPYDPDKDLEPVAMLGQIPLVLVVHPDLPVKSLRELIDLAKSKRGNLNYASFNPGGPSHLAGELLKFQAQIDMVHIPYKGSAPALQDVLGGRVPILFDAISTSLPHIQAGKLRALAVTTNQRSSALPDVPTMQEAGLPSFYVAAWVALYAPRGVPTPVLDQLNGAINKALSDPALKANFERDGWQLAPGTRGDLARFTDGELRKWRDVVQKANIKID